MKNFPIPYPNELVYSAIARAGVYHGLISPKQLLDEVFGDRKIIATLDLPSHLQVISNHLMATGQYSVEQLIYNHTLFPLYAPFITEERRKRAMQMMETVSKGAVHLMLGNAASKIQSSSYFRYCSECMTAQIKIYGEYFWQRDWYLPGLNICPTHGYLNIMNHHIKSHRHQFLPLQSQNTKHRKFKQNEIPKLRKIAHSAEKLLTIPPAASPSFEQWSIFYKEIASDFGYCRRNSIVFEKISEHITSQFPPNLLQQINLNYAPDTESNWLKTIFRKHRKSFSYLEHLIVWNTFLPHEKPNDIITYVQSIKKYHIVPKSTDMPSSSTSEINDQLRHRWELQVKKYGITNGSVALTIDTQI